MGSIEEFTKSHLTWMEEALLKNPSLREEKWTRSLAVGDQRFAEHYLDALGFKVRYRDVQIDDDCYMVRAQNPAYNGGFSL